MSLLIAAPESSQLILLLAALCFGIATGIDVICRVPHKQKPPLIGGAIHLGTHNEPVGWASTSESNRRHVGPSLKCPQCTDLAGDSSQNRILSAKVAGEAQDQLTPPF